MSDTTSSADDLRSPCHFAPIQPGGPVVWCAAPGCRQPFPAGSVELRLSALYLVAADLPDLYAAEGSAPRLFVVPAQQEGQAREVS